MDLRLSHRLTLVFSLFGVAIAGGFQYNHIRELRALTYARQLSLAESTSEAVKALVESQFRGGNPGRLGRNLEMMVRQTDIASIAVYDADHKKIVARYDDSKLLTRVPHPGVAIDQVADGIYDVERPVDIDGNEGWLELGFRTGPLEAHLRELAGGAVRSGVMALLAIALLAWLIGAWFGLQLSRLVPRIEALTRDPMAFRPLRGEGTDEVGRLVAAFNRLGASLKHETLRRLALEREKQELSAMLVHDLKTPLTVIRSGVALLKEQLHDGAPAPKRKNGAAQPGTQDRTIQLLELSSKRLQRMIEDVLQLARLEEVAGLRERAPLDIPAMIRACAKDFDLITSERRQKLAVKLPREELPPVSGDPVLLRRVLDNLVNNAVEHTPAGGQIVLGAAADAGRVKLTVSDSGPGVPPEARADLFRKFFQKDIKRHVGNVGLGLAFCEKVVTRHDGLIGVEDAKPRGACFFVVLPADQPHLL